MFVIQGYRELYKKYNNNNNVVNKKGCQILNEIFFQADVLHDVLVQHSCLYC